MDSRWICARLRLYAIEFRNFWKQDKFGYGWS